MDLDEINRSCKTQIFKDVISDVIHSFRTSVKNLTETKVDIILNKIRLAPIELDSDCFIIEGKIKNLVGGSITCALEQKFINFLNDYIDFDNNLEPGNYGLSGKEIAHFFVENFFDNFSSVSKNGLLNVYVNNQEYNNIKWESNLYYIQYGFKIVGNPQRFKLTVAVDELTSLYFRDN